MRLYGAWHSSEPGFESEAECQAWIDLQENPEEYTVAATSDDFERRTDTEAMVAADKKRDTQRIINLAIQGEQARIAGILGITIRL